MLPKRFSDEWFELMQTWEGEHYKMVQEYHAWLDYRYAQEKLDGFSAEVRHRIFSGG